MPVRLTRKQVAQLTGQKPVQPAKVPDKRATSPSVAIKRETGKIPLPTIGTRYRVKRGMQAVFTTPPPVETLCTVIGIAGERINMEGVQPDTDAVLLFPVSRRQIEVYFEEEST